MCGGCVILLWDFRFGAWWLVGECGIVFDCDGEVGCVEVCDALVFGDGDGAVVFESVGDCSGGCVCIDGCDFGDCLVLEDGCESVVDLCSGVELYVFAVCSCLVCVGGDCAVIELGVFDSVVDGFVLVFVECCFVVVVGVGVFACCIVYVVVGG